ncbi:MAG: hypothetical protein WC408_04900 [Candidatus Micrarchaeia archaeon]|jgi:hypothetical protein
MSFISRIFYGGTDLLFSVFLFFAPQIAGLDLVTFFMFGRAMMTLVGAHITPYTMESKIFYGGSDVLMGLFLLANASALGGMTGNFGLFMLIRGIMTWANIEI